MENRVMDLLKRIFILLAFSYFSFTAILSYAVPVLPFNITVKAGTTLPTTIQPNTTETAFYTVKNNTNIIRNENFVKYLPPNVTQVTSDITVPDLCGETFSLNPRNSGGDSCTLELSIFGPVNANDPDPHNHLFVCFPEGVTCAGTNSPLNVSSIFVVSVAVSPATATIEVNGTLQYTAVVLLSDGTSLNVSSSILTTWTSDNTNVATINATGLATGHAVGTANIIANYQNIASPPATLTVTNPVKSVEIIPLSASVKIGQPPLTQQFNAIAHFADLTTQNVTPLAAWISSNPTVATINNAGVAQGLTAGSTQITASYQGVLSSPNAVFNVVGLSSITVTPASPSIPIGSQQAFTATGHYTDSTTADITTAVTWSVDNPAIATIGDHTGVATGVSGGTTGVHATLQSTVGDATLTVTNDLVSLDISTTPTPADIGTGQTQQYTATGHFLDGSTQDLTNSTSLTWKLTPPSPTPAIASIIQTGLPNAGLLTGLSVGTTTVSAEATIGAITKTSNDITQLVHSDLYIVNTLSPNTNISICKLESNGTILNSNCIQNTLVTNPTSIALNPTLSLAYVSSSADSKISVCTINSVGNFSGCIDSGSTISIPESVAITPDNKWAFVVSDITSVISCTVGTDGTLSVCGPVGAGFFIVPQDITIDLTGTFALVTNNNATYTHCDINTSTGGLFNCGTTGVIIGGGVSFKGITINKERTFAYIVNDIPPRSVIVCPIGAHGAPTPNEAACIQHIDAAFTAPNDIAINDNSTFLYVSNSDSKLTKCSVSGSTISACVNMPPPPIQVFSPIGIAIQRQMQP